MTPGPPPRPRFGSAGIRDLALGVGALTTLKERTQDAEWVSMGAVSDAFDGVVMCASRGLPMRARLLGAGAFGAGGYLLYLSRVLAAQRDEVESLEQHVRLKRSIC